MLHRLLHGLIARYLYDGGWGVGIHIRMKHGATCIKKGKGEN